MTSPSAEGPAPAAQGPGLAGALALYALARLVVIALVALLLALAGVPLVVALLVGIVVALPLSMVLFRGLRGRLDAALAGWRERRSVEREALRARLRGDDATVPGTGASDHRAEGEPDRGQG